MFSPDTKSRALQLLRKIVDAASVFVPFKQTRDTDTAILRLVESLAYRFGILALPGSNMADVTKTIGTTGRDYSTITAWEADLDNGAIYSSSDVAIGECYNDSAFDEQVTVDGGGTVGLSNVILRPATGEGHDGTAGTGVRIVLTSTATTAVLTPSGSTARTLTHIEVDYNGQATSTASLHFVGSAAFVFNRMLIHGLDAGNLSLTCVGTNFGGKVTNTILYAMAVATDAFARTLVGFSNGGNAGQVAEFWNCTAHNITNDTSTGFAYGYSGDNAAAKRVTNCLGTGVTTTGGTHAAFITRASATQNNNASDDASAQGTGSITGITLANQYVSTTVGSEDLHLKSGSDCIDAAADAGTTPTGVNIDIDGRDRDAEADTWDIGADEFVAFGTVVGPSPAAVIAAAVAPAILFGALTLTPVAASSIVAVAQPTVALGGQAISPAPAHTVAASASRTVELGALSLSTDPAAVVASTVDPTVDAGSSVSVAPAAATVVASSVDPTVELGALSLSVDPASVVAATLTPAVVSGNVSVAPATAAAIGATADPTAVLGEIALTPSAASVITAIVDPSITLGDIAVTPSAATSIASTSNPIVVGGANLAPSRGWIALRMRRLWRARQHNRLYIVPPRRRLWRLR